MAGQKFTLTFDANLEVSKMKTALSDVQKSLNGLQLPQNITKNLQSTFQKLSQEVQNFEVQVGKDITSKADFSKLEKSADRINNLFETLKVQLKDIGNLSNKELQKLLPENASKNINDARNALKTYDTTLKDIQDTLDGTKAKLQEQQQKLESYTNAINKSREQYNLFKQQISKDADGNPVFETEVEVLQRLQSEYDKTKQALDNYKKKLDDSKISPTKGQLTWVSRLNNDLTRLKTAMDAIKTPAEIKTLETSAKAASGQITKLQTEVQRLTQNKSGQEADALQTLLKALQQVQGIDFSKFSADAKGAKQAVDDYLNNALKTLINNLNQTQNTVGNQTPVFNNFRQQIQQAGAELVNFDNRMREVEQLKSRIQYFFGLNNAIQLVKRTMREAYQTIKELDAAMTETAVVTDFSVGDMWAQLPDYTKRANELGVSTKAAYEAATLYYQQGLKTNEVMAMSNETLKMARIAGLDAAVATDRMTNAIRGFNMEINTTNAQRIDDVYSKLAAISASNVDEISTAMTKVASLAHSANMEFETTAAFLAQIIETTRESAETAGTALKTVVARFSEVKKLVDEGQLSGSDEEGEVIDVNKVSSALRVAGIDLNKYFLGEVGLDDIFMELASKWDSLTQIQQRFIATQAAGSRQQSRFIALMSDYARTQELVGEAYNANGAAAKQFEKTQESLESKLARLKNAWNEFAMGVLNNDLVKIGVDALTGLLNGINALTSGFGTLNTSAGKFLNTFAKLTLLIGGLKVGKGLTAGLFGSMLSAVTGGKVGGGFVNLAAGAMGISPGKNFLSTLGAGAISPFKSIAKGIGGKLSGIGFNAINANYAGSSALSGKLAAGVFGKLSGVGMATGAAQGIAGVASLLPVIAGITAAAGTAYVAIKKLYDASPAGQVKIAEKYAASISEVADAARASQREIESIQEEYNRLETNVQQATTAEERTEAIKSRTEYIQSLLEQNATYAQYIDQYEVKNGEIFLTLDSDKLAEACEKIAETALKVQSGVDIANANVAFQRYQEAQNDIAKLEMQKVLIEAEQPANQTEVEEKEWRESSGLNQIEVSLIQATNRMLQFQQEYQNFATSGAVKNIQNNKDLDDAAKSAIANALGYAFNGDEVQKILVDNTTDLFGLIPDTVFHTLEGARKRWMTEFETTDIPEDIKDNEKALIDAVAQEKVRKKLEESNDKLVNAYSALNDEQKKIFTDLINNSGENLNLTTTQSISNNLPRILGDFWNLLDKELQEKLVESSSNLSPIETAQNIISKTFLEGSSENSNLFSKIFDFIFDFDLSGKQTEAISKVFTDFAKDNYNSLDDFSKFIRNLIDTISKTENPDDLTNFFDALTLLKIDSTSSIDTFFGLLDGLEIDFNSFGYDLNDAAEELKKLANAAKAFDLEALKGKITDNVSLMRDIKDRKSTQAGYRIFDESEYQLLREAGVDTNSFVYSGIKNKEWTYTGDDLDTLVQALIQNLTAEIQKQSIQLDQDIAKGQVINNASNVNVNGEEVSLADALQQIVSKEINVEDYRNEDWLKNIINQLYGESTLSLTPDALLAKIKEALDYYHQLEVNTQMKEDIGQYANQPMNYITPINEFKPEISDEEYSTAVTSKFYVDEHAEDRYESILKSIKQIDAAGVKWGETAQELETISRALAVNWSEEASKLSELTEVLDKNDKILYEGAEESYEYSGAIHAVGEAMRAAYGEQVSDEFVQAHIQQIVMARESKEAYQELLDILQQDFFSNAKSDLDEFGYMLAAIQQQMIEDGLTAESLNGLEINGVAVLDDTQWMAVIEQLIKAGYDVAAFFDTLGWTVVYGPTNKDGIPTSVQLVRNQPTGYGGYKPYTGNNWGRGSSGGSGSSPKEKEPTKEEWRSDFDWLYNLMEDIAELQREQNKLQEEQNKILELGNDSDTGKDLYENLVKQMANLLTQQTYQSSIAGYRRREMQEFMAANAGYGEYFRFNDQDQTLEINWDAINNIGDKETYEKVKDLVSEAEAIQKKMDDSDDAVRDIEAQIRQLENIWREQYVDFEKRVLDALVKSYQRVIDNYSDLHDTVTKANDDILNALQEEIALERQIRDNTQTEDQISDAEARLAFLRRDTTGGNQVAILSAQKELEDARQSYEDQLIDQSISRLQDDNAKAAEQREKQIELMQAQLDYAVENGEFNNEVRELITGALGADGELLTNSDLFALLQQEESWAAMSTTSKELWENELNNTFKKVSAYLLKEQGEIDGSYLQAVAAEVNEGVWASAQVTDNALEVGFSSMSSALQIGLENIGWNIGSMSQALEHVTYTYDDAINGLREANAELAGAVMQRNQAIAERDTIINATQSAMASGGNRDTSAYWERQHDLEMQQQRQQTQWIEDLSPDAMREEQKKRKRLGFATGGLTTKTGPAWLDGTPAEPEYILNARQTEAFLKLADVLPSIFNGVSTTTNNVGGTMYLNFDINVDSISNDYDVDQLVERVKDDIYNAASYRNANVINFSR